MPANPDCRYCHGTGQVVDYVPYGSTNVPMYTECDCVYDDWIECPICEGIGKCNVCGHGFDVGCENCDCTGECLTCDGTGFVSPEKYDAMKSSELEE